MLLPGELNRFNKIRPSYYISCKKVLDPVLGQDRYPDRHQHIITWSLRPALSLQKSSKYVQNFLSNPADKQTNKQIHPKTLPRSSVGGGCNNDSQSERCVEPLSTRNWERGRSSQEATNNRKYVYGRTSKSNLTRDEYCMPPPVVYIDGSSICYSTVTLTFDLLTVFDPKL